ncbi:hypothetical protein M5D96_014049, partial [Drosophila gunungcola]
MGLDEDYDDDDVIIAPGGGGLRLAPTAAEAVAARRHQRRQRKHQLEQQQQQQQQQQILVSSKICGLGSDSVIEYKFAQMPQSLKPLTTKRRVPPAAPGSTVPLSPLAESPATSSGLRNRHPKIRGVGSKSKLRRSIGNVKEQRNVKQDVRPGSAAVKKDRIETDEDLVEQ